METEGLREGLRYDGGHEESEAETEILNASKNNTPMKPRDSSPPGLQGAMRRLRRRQDEDTARDAYAKPQTYHLRGSKKRKLRDSDAWRGRTRRYGGSESPTKKLRVTSEDEESYYTSSDLDDVRRPEPSWKLRSKRRASAGGDDTRQWAGRGCETQHAEGTGERVKPSDSAPPSQISHFPRRISPHRSSSYEVRPRSTSPYQLHHRRAASYQSAPLLKSEDSERRLRSSLRHSHQPGEHWASSSLPSLL